jgi:phosphoenolpyruvate carboxykinase (ATP)
MYQVNGSRVEWNPSAARLRELTEEMPNASVTEFGNVNVKARVDSRSTRSTYLVEDSTNSRGQTITRAEYERVAALQDAHIAASHMVVVDGFIGSDPTFRTRARLIMEAAGANVAGMQRQLYYPTESDYDPATWEPDTTVIYTPHLKAPGYPDDRLIAVDLKDNITRVLNSDYFGRVQEGRPADVEQHRLRSRRPGPARGLQGRPGARRELDGPDRGPVRYRQDDHHVHHPAGQQARPG